MSWRCCAAPSQGERLPWGRWDDACIAPCCALQPAGGCLLAASANPSTLFSHSRPVPPGFDHLPPLPPSPPPPPPPAPGLPVGWLPPALWDHVEHVARATRGAVLPEHFERPRVQELLLVSWLHWRPGTWRRPCCTAFGGGSRRMPPAVRCCAGLPRCAEHERAAAARLPGSACQGGGQAAGERPCPVHRSLGPGLSGVSSRPPCVDGERQRRVAGAGEQP